MGWTRKHERNENIQTKRLYQERFNRKRQIQTLVKVRKIQSSSQASPKQSHAIRNLVFANTNRPMRQRMTKRQPTQTILIDLPHLIPLLLWNMLLHDGVLLFIYFAAGGSLVIVKRRNSKRRRMPCVVTIHQKFERFRLPGSLFFCLCWRGPIKSCPAGMSALDESSATSSFI